MQNHRFLQKHLEKYSTEIYIENSIKKCKRILTSKTKKIMMTLAKLIIDIIFSIF